MKEKRKIEILSRLRELLAQDVHPTLRDAEITGTEAEELCAENLVMLGDQGPQISEELDRYVVAELQDKAIVLLTAEKGPPQHHVVSHAPAQSMAARTAAGVGKGLGDLFWNTVKVGAGVLIGWWITKHLS